MNVTLFYFSQTGNTRRIARAMAEVFSEAGYSARTLSLKKALPEDALDADVIGVGSPCFSSQAPTPIKNFLRSLPPIPGKPAFVFATSGTAPGRVLYDLYSILRDKGAVVLGGFLTRGTVRHPAPCLYGRLPDRPNAEDLEQARRFAREVVENLAAGRMAWPAWADFTRRAYANRWAIAAVALLLVAGALLRAVTLAPVPANAAGAEGSPGPGTRWTGRGKPPAPGSGATAASAQRFAWALRLKSAQAGQAIRCA